MSQFGMHHAQALRARLRSPLRRSSMLFALTLMGSLLSSASLSAQQGTTKSIVREQAAVGAKLKDDAEKQTRLTPYLSVNINGHTAPVRALAFSGDSQQLYTAGLDKVVQVWRLPSADRPTVPSPWKARRTLRWPIARGLRGTINALSADPDDGDLAVAGLGAFTLGNIVWLNPDDGEQLRNQSFGHGDPVVAMSHSPSGAWLASSDTRGRVLAWKRGEERPREVQPPDNRATMRRPLAVINESFVVVPRYEGEARVRRRDGSESLVPDWRLHTYRLSSGALGETFSTPHYVEVTALAAAVQPNGTELFASADASNGFHLNRHEASGWKRYDVKLAAPVIALSFSADGRFIAVGTLAEGERAGQIHLFSVADAISDAAAGRVRPLFSREDLPRSVFTCALSPNGRWLAYVGGAGSDVYLQPLSGGRAANDLIVINGGEQLDDAELADADDSYAASFALRREDATYRRVFDPATLSLRPEKRLPRDRLPTISPRAFSGDWSAEVAPSRDSLTLREGSARRGVITLRPLDQGWITDLNCYCFLPNEAGEPYAVAIGTDVQNCIYIYQLAARGECELLRMFRGHNERISSLGVSHDGRYLISSSADGTLRYWKLQGLDDQRLAAVHREVPRRWGAQIALEKKDEPLKVSDIVDSGPLFQKGIRNGDRLVKLLWTERGGDGLPIVFSTKTPANIYTKLKTHPWHEQLSFIFERDGKELAPVNSVPGWDHYLAVFVHGDDWIAWHPSGYYASSPDGKRMIGWQLNNEAGKPPLYHPAEKFSDAFEKPAVVKALLAKGSLAEAKLAGGIPGAAQSATTVAEILPPTVRILEPIVAKGDTLRVDKGLLRVRATADARGGPPIRTLRVFVDDVPYSQFAKGIVRESRTREAMWDISLPPGQHKIEVIADNGSSYEFSDGFYVQYEAKPVTPKLHVLAIGISAYPEEDLKLNYADRDAQWITSTLTSYSQGLYELGTVVSLPNEKATRANITKAFADLGRVMEQGVQSKDLAVIFYSGHGVKGQHDKFFLFCVDGARQDIDNTCVSNDEIMRFCEETPGRKVLMVDACHSGAADLLDRERELNGRLRNLDNRKHPVVVFVSSQGDQVSWEAPEWGPDGKGGGAFTHAMVNGLRGDADFTRDNRVTIDELNLYLREEVPRLTRDKPSIQIPDMIKPQALDLLTLTSKLQGSAP